MESTGNLDYVNMSSYARQTEDRVSKYLFGHTVSSIAFENQAVCDFIADAVKRHINADKREKIQNQIDNIQCQIYELQEKSNKLHDRLSVLNDPMYK